MLDAWPPGVRVSSGMWVERSHYVNLAGPPPSVHPFEAQCHGVRTVFGVQHDRCLGDTFVHAAEVHAARAGDAAPLVSIHLASLPQRVPLLRELSSGADRERCAELRDAAQALYRFECLRGEGSDETGGRVGDPFAVIVSDICEF